MEPQLIAANALYLESHSRLHALLEDLPEEAFNQKPAPGSWSVGECVVHLNRTSAGYLPGLEAAASKTGPRGRGPFTYGWVATRFVDALRPGGRPMPTARSMKPPRSAGDRSGIDRAREVARFDADTERFQRVIARADGLDLRRIGVRSPFLPVLRLPLGACLEALGHHAVRHVLQAERAAAAVR